MPTLQNAMNNNHKKIKLLFCAPGENLEGGIDAVVKGMEAGFKTLSNFEWKRVLYAKPRENLTILQRIYAEIKQLIIYVREIIFYQPSGVLVETSFDVKTVIRDSIHLVVAKIFAVPFFLHAHGGEWHCIPKWNPVFRGVARTFLKGCSTIIVTSEEELREIVRQFGEGVKVVKISNPLCLPKPSSVHVRCYNSEKFRIVFASRLIESKGIMDVIYAMTFLKNLDDIELHVYGKGDKYEEAQYEVLVKNLEKQVFFKGNIPLTELLNEYACCDVYLFPSYHLEGFPMALFYAVAMGAPVIATKIRSLPEYLREPDNCLWTEPRNPEMLAQKILFLRANEPLRKLMRENNKILAKNFEPEVIAHKFQKVWEKVM